MTAQNSNDEGVVLEIEIPEDVEVGVDNNVVNVRGRKGELKRKIPEFIKIDKKDKKIYLSINSKKRREKAILGTMRGHIANMIKGVSRGIEYKLRILYTHFPVSVKVSGNNLMIENFMGERYPRRARILEGVDVEINGNEIILSGIDKEKVSQTAANIEQATRIKNKDPRIFQDGIYIVEKDGKRIV
ncbi:MAG: 50S ribosomal protein L6 [Candidatus Altiarchaeales archaeon]|nr:MAG: 50S ribosomal protein L6 [Candidatus Altiarchaeales archaeon]